MLGLPASACSCTGAGRKGGKTGDWQGEQGQEAWGGQSALAQLQAQLQSSWHRARMQHAAAQRNTAQKAGQHPRQRLGHEASLAAGAAPARQAAQTVARSYGELAALALATPLEPRAAQQHSARSSTLAVLIPAQCSHLHNFYCTRRKEQQHHAQPNTHTTSTAAPAPA